MRNVIECDKNVHVAFTKEPSHGCDRYTVTNSTVQEAIEYKYLGGVFTAHWRCKDTALNLKTYL